MAISKKIRHKLIDVGVSLGQHENLPTLLDGAEIDHNDIVFTGAANTRWSNVIAHLDSTNQLDLFLVELTNRFPKNQALKEIRDDIAKTSVQAMANHLRSIFDNNQCVLFIGPESLRCSEDDRLITFNRFLSRQLAAQLDKFGIFYEGDQVENLSYIIDRYETKEKFVPGDTESFARDIYNGNQIIHCYQNLMPFKFPLIINTNPDTIFPDLLGKDKCIVRYYDMTNTAPTNFPKEIDRPIIYNIYGSFENIFSILFTEKEAVEFTKKAYEKNPSIPFEIKNIIQQSYGLFIGFDFRDWHLKILFDILDLKNKPGNYALSDISTKISEYDKEYYERQYNITFVKNNIPRFLKLI